MTIPNCLRLDFEEYCKDCPQIDVKTEWFNRIVNNKSLDECVIYCKNARLCQHLMTHVAKDVSK